MFYLLMSGVLQKADDEYQKCINLLAKLCYCRLPLNLPTAQNAGDALSAITLNMPELSYLPGGINLCVGVDG